MGNEIGMPYPSPYIAILDVGHGSSTVLRDGEFIVVIDCGAKSSGLKEFLNQEGITKISKVFISHADADHIGALVGIISTGEFEIDEVLFNSDGSKGTDAWEDFAYVCDEQHECGDTKFTPGIAKKTQRIQCGSIELEIMSPTPYLVAKGVGGKDRHGRTINSNSISASFKVIWKDDVYVFLSGDIDQIGLDEMLMHDVDLRSPILVFPHHGGKSGSASPVPFTELLCDIVKPQTVVFSIGRSSKFDNPRPEIVDSVKRKIKDVRISCTQLSKHCMKKLAFGSLDHLADVYSRGRDNHFSCSGTFIIELGHNVLHLPEVGLHQTFIKAATLTPLCLDR